VKRLSRIDFLILLALCGLFVYASLRAVLLDVTNDEAYSFYTMKNFWYAEVLCTGNTHWLNSIAIKTAITLHLESPWQIRWLSLLSTFVFFWIIFLWIRSVENPAVKFLIFSVLLLNPYIIDYFVLARGYAPGLMLEALAMFLLLRTLTTNELKPAFYALLCAGLSALANFSFVYFFLAFSLIYFFVFYFKKGRTFLRTFSFYRDGIFVLFIFALVARAFLFMTRCSYDVSGAGTNDFTEYPMVFIHGLVYDRFMDPVLLKFLSPPVFVGIVICCLVGILHKNASDDRLYFFSSQILLIMLITIGILHTFFGIVFPYYRSVIFLFPTTAICFVCLLNKISVSEVHKKIIIGSLGFLLMINFISTLNIKSVFDYFQQADLEESFDYLESIGARRVGISPELYGGFRNYYKVNINRSYNFTGGLINTRIRKNNDIPYKDLSTFDYLLIAPPYDLSYYKGSKIKLEALKWFKESGTLVVKVETVL